MQTNAIMIDWKQMTSQQNFRDDSMLDTIGDRMNDMLRTRGRADKGEPYTQHELFEMLTGRRLGPDGKRYAIATNKSTLNRIMLDKQQAPNDLLFAFCDMFETDTEWILRGKILESPKTPERFVTDEANEVGAMIDTMPSNLRRMMLDAAKASQQLSQELLASQRRIAQLLEENIMLLENGDRSIAHDYIESIGYHRNVLR